ncbi:serine/threonine-protein kinase [Paludisphaera mucosa]|uniref:Tetratricopeptide repeat protein n=1 Tax=Paludisphaera mucosa TaxID=3030827 RepID=A0ABT6FLG9_9BACT|nr:serine/threonine-protein kinase [Paludisphaera mucosa]MDG3008416.1 tetratricopeptide repeat protein [Paludisphaera mucosa]
MPSPDPQLMTVFSDALERNDPAARAAYLDEACRGNAGLRRLVEEMLAAHDGAGRFLEPGPPATAESSSIANLPVTERAAPESPARAGTATEAHDRDGSSTKAASLQFSAESAGTVVAGRYKLLQQIGEGGMGTVWMADQTDPVRRRVAVKLIRVHQGNSRTILSRFEAERQAIALMDHPHIAKLLDAGTTADGSPFFVMELVKGVPLNEYCDAHHLSIRDRLALFVQICSAVQHAHQKGIIHRDLKPTNILVEDHDGKPMPRVIDFGLAKATSGLQLSENTLFTAFGSVMGTPLYMAPEQAAFNAVDVDTRADVYALGVILYELLTGTTPITRESMKKAALDEMLRLIREQDAPTPSSRLSTVDSAPSIAANRRTEPQKLGRFVKGELDWIVLKALSKERDRRYETATGFGRDVERFLNNEAVAAGPPSASYRLRKFVKRNRGQVLAASLVLLALLAGIAGTTLGLVEARRSADAERKAKRDAEEKSVLAESNEKKALAAAEEEKKAKESVESVLGFVEGKIFAAARPKGQEGGLGYDVKLVDAITASLPSIDGDFRGRPLIEARLRRTIGNSFFFLSLFDRALEQHEADYKIRRRELGPDHIDTLKSLMNVATNYWLVGRRAEGINRMEEAVRLMKAGQGPDYELAIWSMGNLAGMYLEAGRHAEAIETQQEVVARQTSKVGPEHYDTTFAKLNLARMYDEMGHHAEALKLFEEALPREEAALGRDHPDTLASTTDLAKIYNELGRHAESLSLFEKTLPLLKDKFGPDHRSTLAANSVLADVYSALGREADALRLLEETLARGKAQFGPDHVYTLESMTSLARVHMAAGRGDRAKALLEECSAASRKEPASSWKVAALQAWFGLDDDFAETRTRILEFARGTNDATTALRAAQVGALRPSDDQAVQRETLDLGRKAVELHKGERQLLALGMAEYRIGRFAEAEKTFQSAATPWRDITAADTADFYRAMCLFRLGRKEEARDLATRTAGRMKPLPKVGQGPGSGNSGDSGNLILWLAYKEAKMTIDLEEPPPRR